MRFRISKFQAKMLLEGKPLVNGRRKMYATEDVKKDLKIIDEADAYDRVEMFIEDNGFVVKFKETA